MNRHTVRSSDDTDISVVDTGRGQVRPAPVSTRKSNMRNEDFLHRNRIVDRTRRSRSWQGATAICGFAIALAACGGGDAARSSGAVAQSDPSSPATLSAVSTTASTDDAMPDTTMLPASSSVATTTTSETELLADVESTERADPAVFDYAARGAVDYEVTATETFRGVEIERIKFPSPVGGDATGYLAQPADDPVDVGILWAHGIPADGTESFVPMSIFACAGATSVVVDAPYARASTDRWDSEILFTPEDRDEQIQLVIDMRRATDLLVELGSESLGFEGMSYGAAIGGQLLGIDDRFEAAVFLLGNGGLVDRFTDDSGAPAWPLTDYPDHAIRAWFDAMLPIEPIRFVGDSTAAILFMNGADDPLIPPAEAERYHAAGPPDSEVYWMESAHDIPFEDVDVHNNWLGEHLGMDPERLATCTDGLFPNGWSDL